MNINVNNSSISTATQSTQTASTGRPDGSSLFTNRYTDDVSQSATQPLVYNNQSAHNPQLNQPIPVAKNAPMQDDEPTDAQLSKEYDFAVLAGIKEKSFDQQTIDRLTQAYIRKDYSLDDAALTETLGQIMQEGREDVNKAHKRDKDAPIPIRGEPGEQTFKEQAAREQMKKYPNLFVNGQLTDKGHQTLRAIMTGNTHGNAEAQEINSAVNEALGFTPSVDADSFNAKIGLEFEQVFNDQIKELPDDQQKRLTYLFNMDPGNAEVKPFIDKATAQIQGKWGADVQIVKENLSYRFQVNGEYQFELDTQLKKIGPNLTYDEMALIKNYLKAAQNGEKFEIPESLKGLAQTANAAALTHVRSLFVLPASWKPDLSISMDSILGSIQAKAYHAMTDQLLAMQARIETLPKSPEQSKLTDLLKKISDALSELKQMLFETAAQDASGSADLSRAQAAMVKDKADKMKAVAAERKKEQAQQAEIDQKAAEQAKKQEWMGPLMIAATVVLTIIAAIVTVLTFGLTSTATILLVVGLVIMILSMTPSGRVDEKTGKSLTVMNEIMNGLNKGIDALAGAIFGENSQAAQIFGTILRATLIVAAIVAGAVSGQFVLVLPIIITFIVESGFMERMIGDVVKASGAEKPPEWLAAAINGAIIFTLIFASFFCKSGSSASKLAEETGKLSKLKELIKSASASKALNNSLLVVEAAAIGTQAAVMISQGVTELQMKELKEKMAQRIRATAAVEAQVAEIDVMIKFLQKIIDLLFGHMDDMTKWAEDTGKQMDQRWADKTEMMTNLNSAQ